MDINTFSTYFIDNAKKVIDPIVYAGRYGRTKTKILNQPDYMYGYYGVYGDWGELWAIYDITVGPKSINLKCGVQYLNIKSVKNARITVKYATDDAVNERMIRMFQDTINDFKVKYNELVQMYHTMPLL